MPLTLDTRSMLPLQQDSDNSVTIAPIETRAYGRFFRSRLEARWAVFFTSLGLEWEYEPEGFNVNGLHYLPDFRVWTPQGEPIWYEIKHKDVRSDEKFSAFAEELSRLAYDGDIAFRRTLLLSGDPNHFFQNHSICPRCGFFLEAGDVYDCGDEVGANCFYCDIETPCGGGNPDEYNGLGGLIYHPHKGWVQTQQNEWHELNRRLDRAIDNATSARFEHGKAP